MKKWCIFLLGLTLVSLGIALNIKSTLGSSPIDSLVFNFANAFRIDSSISLFIINAIMIVIYFLINPNKKVLVLILATIILSVELFVFQNYVVTFTVSNIGLKILTFIIALNLISFGVALEIKSKLATTALEGIVLTIQKKFSKLSFGLCRTLFELLVIIIAGAISLIATKTLGEVGIATIIMLACCGLLTDLYLKLMEVIFREKSNN